MPDVVISVRPHGGFRRHGKMCGGLGRIDCGLGSRETDEGLVEAVEIGPEYLRRIAARIGCHEHDFELFRRCCWQLLERFRDHVHLQRAHVGTMRIPKKQQRHISARSRQKVERAP
jgi:hypothetical protein